MTEAVPQNPTNLDFKNTLRGKCKDINCDCEEYCKTDTNGCAMCGCYPGKHELLATEASPILVKAVNTALSQLTSPSKVAEIDIETGNIIVHSSKEPNTNGARRKLDLAESSVPNTDAMMETDDDFAGNRGNDQDDSDDPLKDPDFNPNDVSEPMEEIEAHKETVTTSRNAVASNTDFSPIAVRSGFVSMDLQAKIDKHGLLRHEDSFVSEAASYLLSLSKKEKPTQTEQNIFCSRIVDFYPALKSNIGKNPWGAFKTTLSRHLVQRRYRAKHAKSTPTFKSCAFVAAEPEDEQSLDDLLTKLKEVTRRSPDAAVRSLIKHTSTARRVTMATDDNEKYPRMIIEMWPHLSVADWLIYDFYSFKEFNEKEFETNVDVFLQRLAKMFKEESGEKGYAENLNMMSKKLNKQSKKLSDIITIIEPLGSLEPLKSKETEAPRLVLTVGTTINQCYLVLDTKRMELEAPTVQRAVTLLMAAYYVFDVKYPDVYSNFLTVLDVECAKKPDVIKATQRTLFKFVRELSSVTTDDEGVILKKG